MQATGDNLNLDKKDSEFVFVQQRNTLQPGSWIVGIRGHGFSFRSKEKASCCLEFEWRHRTIRIPETTDCIHRNLADRNFDAVEESIDGRNLVAEDGHTIWWRGRGVGVWRK